MFDGMTGLAYIATDASRRLAHSAMPDAPVVPDLPRQRRGHVRPRAAQVLRRAAEALRRAAETLEPTPCTATTGAAVPSRT